MCVEQTKQGKKDLGERIVLIGTQSERGKKREKEKEKNYPVGRKEENNCFTTGGTEKENNGGLG
jgi:uncharacterized membrane protein